MSGHEPLRALLIEFDDEVGDLGNLLTAMRRVSWDLTEEITEEHPPWLREVRDAMSGLNVAIERQLARVRERSEQVWEALK